MIENTPLALLPLIASTLLLAAKFYARDGADSIFRLSFLGIALSVALLVTYMTLVVLSLLPPYAWVGFGGAGLAMSALGIWSFNR